MAWSNILTHQNGVTRSSHQHLDFGMDSEAVPTATGQKIVYNFQPGCREQILATLATEAGQVRELWVRHASTAAPPMSPSLFRAQLATKKFTGRGDEAMVADLYQKLFQRCFASTEKLILFDLNWTASKAKQLGDVLRELPCLGKLLLGHRTSLGPVLPSLVEGLLAACGR